MASNFRTVLITAVVTAVVTSVFWLAAGVVAYRWVVSDSPGFVGTEEDGTAKARRR